METQLLHTQYYQGGDIFKAFESAIEMQTL